MRKTTLSLTGALLGSALAVSPALGGDMGDTLEQATKNSQVVLDWLAGKGQYGKNEVSYDGPAFTLRSSSHVPPVSGLAKLQINGWNQLEKMSGGKIKVETSWSQTVHSAKEGRKAVRTGLSDHAPCFSLYTARDYDMTGGLGLPFLFTNSHEAVATAEALYPKYLKKEFEKYGVLIMREAHTSPYHLYNNKPVQTLEDIQGMKVRAGGGTHSAIVNALGASQASMPAPDIVPAMQRKTIDAVHFNDAAADTFKINEVSKFRTLNGFNVLTVEYCLSKEFFDDLPADLQVVVNNWGRQMAIAEAIGFYDYGGVVAVDKMAKKTGLKTVPLKDVEKWKAAVAGVEQKWIDDTAKKGLPAAAFIADIKATSAKYAAMSPNEVMLAAINNPQQGMYDMKK